MHWKGGDWKVTESLISTVLIIYYLGQNRTEQNVSESGHISKLTYEGENAPSLFGSNRRSLSFSLDNRSQSTEPMQASRIIFCEWEIKTRALMYI
jgi:hypothetical protein